jgi:hypothetical protein
VNLAAPVVPALCVEVQGQVIPVRVGQALGGGELLVALVVSVWAVLAHFCPGALRVDHCIAGLERIE